MSARETIHVDPRVKDRLDALAAGRGVDPADLLAELVLAAETAEVVAEVNRELERLSQGPVERRRQAAAVRQLESTLSGLMRE